MRNYAPDYERLMGRIKEGSERTLKAVGNSTAIGVVKIRDDWPNPAAHIWSPMSRR